MARAQSIRSRLLRAALPVFEPLEPRCLYSSDGLMPPTSHQSSHQRHAALNKPNRPNLQRSSDDGVSSTDNLTSVQAPVFTVGRVDAGVTLQLLRDGVVVASVLSGPGGRVAIQDFGPVPAGTHTYAAREMNTAGQFSAVGRGLSVTFVVVNTPSTPDMADVSDSGASNTDNMTSVTNPSFTIGNIASGDTVTLLRDGVAVASGVASGSTLTLQDAGPLSDGTYNYAASVVDSNGFSSAASTALSVTIDTTVPGAPVAPDLTADSDTGTSDSDNITSSHTMSFVVSGVESGATVQLLRDGVVVATGVASSDSITLSETVASDGAYAYTAGQTDLAGNESGLSSALDVSVVPNKPATPAAPDLQSAGDTGASDTDNVTANSAPTFDIAGVTSGMTVQLLRDGVVVASGVASADSISLQDTSAPADGTYQYTSQQINSTGGVSDPSSALGVTLDTTAPAAVSTPTLALSSDSGIQGDGITRDRLPVFTVTGLEDGATVQLLVDGVPVGSAVASAGSASVGPTSALTPGAHVFSARQIDLAGNIGLAGGSMNLSLVNATASSDYDGDGISDPAIFTDGTGLWQILLSAGGTHSEVLGDGGGWTPIPGDFDGDGKTDLAVYTPGVFVINPSSQPGNQLLQFFGTGSTPLPIAADYDADGKTDIASYDGSTGRFDILLSSTGASINLTLGAGGANLPVVADYDGDGKADPAVYNPATGVWTIHQSTTAAVVTETFGGQSSQVPVPADYDGDGFDDLAVYDSSTSTFLVLASNGSGTMVQSVGAPGSHPVAADFDGDGKTDFAVYDPATATFTIDESTAGNTTIVLGNAGDPNEPLPLSIDQVSQDILA